MLGGRVIARFGLVASDTGSSDALTGIGSGVFKISASLWGCFDSGSVDGADSIVFGDSNALPSSVVGVDGPEGLLAKRGLLNAGDRFVGRVLLRCTPEAGGVTKPGVTGLGTAPEWRERLDEVETFLRTPPYRRKLSAPALDDVEAERLTPELFLPGVVGVRA